MTDNEIFEEVKQRFTDPKVMDLLRNGLADPEEMEVVKRALRYGDAVMTIPSLRSTLYKVFDRLLNVVKDDSTTRQMVKQDLRKLQKGDSDMSENLDTANVAKAVAHDCAKHVVHETWGKGQCIAGEHTLLEDGTVTHYDVMFEHGIEQDVPVADLTVVVSESHMHASKKKKPAMEEEAVAPAGGEDSSKASKKGKPEMPLEKLKAIMEKKKSKAYIAMLKSQGKMEEETEIEEKTLTKAEMKKREEVAKAIERDQPGMPMGKKMAIATATAKKVAEAKAHTVPKTAKEKSLAALAAPHDKITHADVMVGRGVSKKKTMKEFVEKLAESLIVESEDKHEEVGMHNGDVFKPPLHGGYKSTQDNPKAHENVEKAHHEMVDHIARHLPHMDPKARKETVKDVGRISKKFHSAMEVDPHSQTDSEAERIEDHHAAMRRETNHAQTSSGLHSSKTLHGQHGSNPEFKKHHQHLMNALENGDHKGAEEAIAAMKGMKGK